MENRIKIRLDSNTSTFTSGFHEKIIVIDDQVAFCAGYDLMNDKWDTNYHDFDNLFRDENSLPWHDIHIIVKGPIVWDFLFHFNQRWIFAMTKKVQLARETRIDSLAFSSLTNSFFLVIIILVISVTLK